jgi:hypothetical protein
MSRCTFCEYKGKKIFCIDVENCNAEEFEAILTESAKIIRKHPYASLLTMATGGEGTPLTTNKGYFIEYLAMNAPHVRAAAVVGLPAIKKEIFAGIMNLASREMRFFNTADEAKEWLASIK